MRDAFFSLWMNCWFHFSRSPKKSKKSGSSVILIIVIPSSNKSGKNITKNEFVLNSWIDSCKLSARPNPLHLSRMQLNLVFGTQDSLHKLWTQDQIPYICLQCLQHLNSFVTYSPLERGNRIWCLELKLPITSSNPDSNPWLIDWTWSMILIVLVKSCPSGVYPLLNL